MNPIAEIVIYTTTTIGSDRNSCFDVRFEFCISNARNVSKARAEMIVYACTTLLSLQGTKSCMRSSFYITVYYESRGDADDKTVRRIVRYRTVAAIKSFIKVVNLMFVVLSTRNCPNSRDPKTETPDRIEVALGLLGTRTYAGLL
jgi:hypothetical protein